jgi:hypothetical protein
MVAFFLLAIPYLIQQSIQYVVGFLHTDSRVDNERRFEK